MKMDENEWKDEWSNLARRVSFKLSNKGWVFEPELVNFCHSEVFVFNLENVCRYSNT